MYTLFQLTSATHMRKNKLEQQELVTVTYHSLSPTQNTVCQEFGRHMSYTQ